MRERSIRKERAYRRGMVIVSAAVLVLALFISWQILSIRRQNEALRLNEAALRESVTEENQKSESLDARAKHELTEEEIIDIAHDRFGLVFPNEIVLIPSE